MGSPRDVFAELARQGVHVVLSDSDTALVRRLYRGFGVERVLARRAINSRADRRGKVEEAIVRGWRKGRAMSALVKALKKTDRVLKRWEDFPSISHAYPPGKFIFRGQQSSASGLRTALERHCRALGIKPKRWPLVEDELYREFRRRYQHYSAHVPLPNDDLEWFAVMQHHGAPTRLLDWSYSIYVAAYFALEDATGACAIWAIRKNWLDNKAATVLCENKRPGTYLRGRTTERTARDFRRCFRPGPIVMVASVNPFRLNERLTLQKGVFLMPGDVSKPFEKNLMAMPEWEDNVSRIVLPRKLRKPSLEGLYYMNVSRATLFPGLDGFARSLSVYYPRAYEPEKD